MEKRSKGNSLKYIGAGFIYGGIVAPDLLWSGSALIYAGAMLAAVAGAAATAIGERIGLMIFAWVKIKYRNFKNKRNAKDNTRKFTGPERRQPDPGRNRNAG